MIDINNVPKELLTNREVLECNFIFSLYQNPSMLSEYKNVENGSDIITKDGMFYYGLLEAMTKAGFNTMDHMAIYTYIEDKPTLKEGFEKRGGYGTVKDITSVLSEKNLGTYYDELRRSNLLVRLDKAGFNVTKNLEKFNDMSAEQIYDFYEYQLANITVGKIDKIKASNLSEADAYKDAIREWDKGSDVGIRISSKMLNHQLLGVHKKNLMLHLAGIGFGKTSSAIAWYVIPALEDGVNVTILANEQDEDTWRKMVLSTVLFSKIGRVEGFSRHNLSKGGYTQEQFDKMDQAADWIAMQPGKLNFVELEDYNIESVKKIITAQSKIGYELFIFDTMKSQTDANTNAWGEFSDVAKELFLLAKHLDVAVVATAQLSPDAMGRKFLDLTCIGRARAIAETANSVVMFRPIQPEEYDKLKGFTFEGKIKKEVTLDPEKQYIVVYTPKNRYGQVSPQIIMERNLNFNTYHDYCWWNCPYDNFMRR